MGEEGRQGFLHSLQISFLMSCVSFFFFLSFNSLSWKSAWKGFLRDEGPGFPTHPLFSSCPKSGLSARGSDVHFFFPFLFLSFFLSFFLVSPSFFLVQMLFHTCSSTSGSHWVEPSDLSWVRRERGGETKMKRMEPILNGLEFRVATCLLR